MKKALIVGINKYQLAGNNLNGCVNDVTNIRDVLLKYYGFEVSNMRVLVDERATKKNIVERLNWLVSKPSAGDNLVFHFSGHGSQIRDRNGDELRDKMDEVLCPHDMDWEGNYITDDDLAEIFEGLSNVVLDVILDCCHSGSGTRNPNHIIPRFIKPPIDIRCRNEDDLPKRGLFSWLADLLFPNKQSSEDKPIVGLNHSLLAACRDYQVAADAEIDNVPNGAFSYYLCKHIRDTNGKISRVELRDRVRASLKYHKFEQIPQLEAPENMFSKEIFK